MSGWENRAGCCILYRMVRYCQGTQDTPSPPAAMKLTTPPAVDTQIGDETVIAVRTITHGPGYPNRQVAFIMAVRGPRGGRKTWHVGTSGKVIARYPDLLIPEGVTHCDGNA